MIVFLKYDNLNFMHNKVLFSGIGIVFSKDKLLNNKRLWL